MKKYLNPEYAMSVVATADIITDSVDSQVIYNGNDYVQTKDVTYNENKEVVSVSTTVTANVNTLLGL